MDDRWPEPTRLPASYVINTDRARDKGQHWVAFFIDKDKSTDYWDSYGTAPVRKMYRWLRARKCDPIRYNRKMVQGFTARTCGAYCVYFLHMRAMGVPLDMITDTFINYQFDYNDALVRALLKKLK
jgi:hypothetical protein